MFISLYDRVCELEETYNSWLKEISNTVLKKLSNNSPLCSIEDAINIGKFKVLNCDVDRVEVGLSDIINENNDESFRTMFRDFTWYQTDHFEYVHVKSFIDSHGARMYKPFELRYIFGGSNLTNIDTIIKLFIDKKEIFKSLEPKYDNVIGYIDALVHNIKSLTLFVNLQEEDITDNFIEECAPTLLNIISHSNINYSEMHYYENNEDLNIINDELSNESDESDKKELDDAKEAREKLKYIGKTILKVKNSIDKGKLNVKHFIDKFNIVRNMFYSKNLGKIDGLYEHYSSEAVVAENVLIDDPVQILMGKCGVYLSHLIDNIIFIYHSYNNHMNKLFNCKSYHEMIIQINEYITLKDAKLTAESKPGDIRKSLVRDLRYKVAHAILHDHKVYGYTVESITEQKYPPIQHVMVCLFIEKPHEKPIEQSVSDIFKSSESFKMMGKKFKEVVLESSKLVTNKLGSISIENDFKKINNHLELFIKDSKTGIKVGADNKMETNKDQHNDLKMRISVLKDYRSILESFVPLCIYVSDAGNAMYDIAMRVDYTCRDAVKAMLNVERKHSDPHYKHDTSRGKDYKYTSKDKLDHMNTVKEGAGVNSKKARAEKIKQALGKRIEEDRTTKFNF